MTAAIYFTGGPHSPLLPIYVIEIAVLSLLSNFGVTVMMAGITVVAFTVMLVLMAIGVLPPTPVPGQVGVAPSAGYVVVASIYCAFVVGVPALFSAATLRMLRSKERALEQRTSELVEAGTQRSHIMASMTHELRTPIHGIQGLSDLIAAGVYGPVTDKQREASASIKRSAQALLGLVDDVLNLARAEAGRVEARPSAVDVEGLIHQVSASVSWMIGTKRLHLDTAIEPELPTLHSDPRWLAHILVNLVANAVKFTPEGGRVTVGARRRAGSVVLSVEDTGIGIAPADQRTIFEPFRQAHGGDERGYGGVGLGLALVARLTDLLGGRIELVSTLGKGSTFRVVVPLTWGGRDSTGLIRVPTPPELVDR
jgi:signal transduction histidine kinase